MKIGIDIGGSHIAAGLVDENNNIIQKYEYNWTNEEKLNLVESSKKYCSQIIKELIKD